MYSNVSLILGNLSLGQPCTHNVQSTGTEHGEKCLKGECVCEEGFVSQKDTCIHVPNKTMDNCIGTYIKQSVYLLSTLLELKALMRYLDLLSICLSVNISRFQIFDFGQAIKIQFCTINGPQSYTRRNNYEIV